MIYVGVDLHKKYSCATGMDREGEIVIQERVEHAPEALEAFI